MAEVLLFNHIPKTAGSTMRRVLFRTAGRAAFATTIGEHRRDVAAMREELLGDDPPSVVIAHTGFGLHERLPNVHVYRQFTFLREPVERTISSFFYARDVTGRLDRDMTLGEFLEEETFRAFNLQTAYLGGLAIRHHLDGVVLSRDEFDRSLLDRAKAALEMQEVIGFTDEFDRSLAALRKRFGWSAYRSLNVLINRGKRPKSLSERERRAVEEANELDRELFVHAKERVRLPDETRGFARANRAYRWAYPIASKAARSLPVGR